MGKAGLAGGAGRTRSGRREVAASEGPAGRWGRRSHSGHLGRLGHRPALPAAHAAHPEETRDLGTMVLSEEEALLQLEETFLTSLSKMDSDILQPLLSAESEPQGKEYLQQLHESTRSLQEVTAQSLYSLEKRQQDPSSSLSTLVLLSRPHQVQKVHIEYIESYTNCIVALAFQKATKKKGVSQNGWRKVLPDSRDSFSTMLAQAVCQPLTQHVQKYFSLLLDMSRSLEEGHPSQKLVLEAFRLFKELQFFLEQALGQAKATQGLWDTLSRQIRDELCTPAHRLLLDSRDVPVTVTPLQANRVLLFDDALVLVQDNSFQAFHLKLVWDDSKDKCLIRTPEKNFSLCTRNHNDLVIWKWNITQAVCQVLRGQKDFPVLRTGSEQTVPHTRRKEAYTFCQEGDLCLATYDGEWSRGRPHGTGTLKWPDGRWYRGNFHRGMRHGFGIFLLPRTQDKSDCYKCHWHKDRIWGYGVCKYGTGETYKGYFQDFLRHGFGVLDSAPHAPQAFRYTGHWEKDQRNGFGIQDDNARDERYIGMWKADRRHGPGIVVNQVGHCYQGTFQMDNVTGPGVLQCEDYLYEGPITRDLMPMGKGKVTFPNGFVLEGLLNKMTGKGFFTQGVLNTAACPSGSSSTSKRQLGVGAFPTNDRWHGVFDPFWAFVREGCPKDRQQAFLGFHDQRSKESQENLCYQRSCSEEDNTDKVKDILEEILQHRKPEALQPYLKKALGDSQHPLGKLLETLMLTFQATYGGVGANKYLQGLAQEEVKQHARRLWAAYRALLRAALESKGQTLEEEADQEGTLILPLVLPSFQAELFPLYVFLHEREDHLYSCNFTRLSPLPDITLLEILAVPQYLWPIKDKKLASNQKYPNSGEKCFLSATECLQNILTTMDPQEKLEVLNETYKEIEATMMRETGQSHQLSTEELLPLFTYVVLQARIQHLGAEIHLIRDMMISSSGGMYDFLLTALESCYMHIQKYPLPG